MSQFIYVISMGDDAQKIGISDDPANRVAQLQTGNPYRLRLVFSMPCERALWVERMVHTELARWRMCGEWFGVGVIAAVQVVCSKILAAEYPEVSRDADSMFGWVDERTVTYGVPPVIDQEEAA